MKKIKLLKMIGCVALVATPVIIAPIVMSTSCSTTDPTNPEVEVTSIQGIKLVQGGKSIIDKSNSSGTATYLSAEVANKNATAAINLTIEIYFYINNDPAPVKLSTIKNKGDIVLDFVCTVSSNNSTNVFEINDNSNIVFSNEKIIENTNYADYFCSFVETTPPKGHFLIETDSKLKLSYNMKNATNVGVTNIDFIKI